MKQFLVTISIILLIVSISVADTVRGAKTPSISPDGSQIVFSYLGDLWTTSIDGGLAARLTTHPGQDINPVWSPDGKWIAFSSERAGNCDAYIVPARGGQSKRLTYHSRSDWVTGWSPDSKTVYFYTRGRMKRQFDIFRIAIDGLIPEQLTTTQGRYGNASPDGLEFVYYRYGSHAWRKGYNGSNNGDLWRVDADGVHHRLTEYDGHDLYPRWAQADGIFFISDRDSIFNVWKIHPRTKTLTQISFHKEDGVQHLDVSADGQTIIYEYNFGLWTVPTAGGQPRQIAIEAFSDHSRDPIAYKTVTKGFDNPVLSPDNKRIAFSAHGEIFVAKANPKKSDQDERRLTRSIARDYRPMWSPDNEQIAFISDRDGNRNIWVIPAVGGVAKQLTHNTDIDLIDLRWSPDGNWLAYQDQSESLFLIEAKGGESRLLDRGPELYTPAWSHDSKWIAYEKHNDKGMGNIFAVPVKGGEPIDLTQDRRGHDMVPKWHPDGKRLLFLSDLEEQFNIYILRLTKEADPDDPAEKRKSGVDEDEEKDKDDDEDSEEGTENKKKDKDAKKEAPKPVVIDLDGIDERTRKLTDLPRGTINLALSSDGKKVAYITSKKVDGGLDIWTISLSGEDEKRHTKSSKVDTRNNAPDQNRSYYGLALQWDEDGKHIYFQEEGNFKRVDTGSDKSKSFNFSVKLEYDRRDQFKQMFADCWRGLRDNFYDPKMHEVDWQAIYDKYYPLLDHIDNHDAFRDLVYEMIGELDSSHLGIWSTTDPGPDRPTGHLGLSVEMTESGYYRVTDVEKDSPANDEIEDNRIQVGDYILAIDKEAVTTDRNFYSYLNGTINERLEILVNTTPTTNGARTVNQIPIGRRDFFDLLYENEVDENKEKVKALSDDRIGYHHIRGMNQECLQKFRRSLFYEVDKFDGLVLDVRGNGGGGIHEQLIDILERKPFAFAHRRHDEKALQPSRMFEKPVVLLINQHSFSDAEIFPHIFRECGIGTIVGVPTAGGVIGTGGMRLIDGSHFRLPRVGWYGLDMTNLENYGVPPDVRVENDPNSLIAGKDPQLEKAVELVLEQIGK